MNRKNLLLIAVFFCLSVSISYTQNEVSNVVDSENSSTTESKSIDENKSAFQLNPNALGFYACYPIMGFFSYQRWINKFGIQFTAGGFATSRNYATYNLQLQLQGMVFGKDVESWFAVAFYPFAILGHSGDGHPGANPGDPMKFNFSYYFGTGIAFELVFVKHLSLTLDLSLIGVYPWRLTMGGGGGIKFRF